MKNKGLMATLTADRVKVRTDGLAGFYSALASALTETGLSGPQLNDLLSKTVSAECAQCGTALSGEEMGQLASADPKVEVANAKLKRLRLGYCGSAGCNSCFYAVDLSAYPNVDWARVVAKVEGQTASLEHEPTAAPELTLPQTPRRKLLLRLGIGAVIILVLLLLRHLWSGGAIPIFHQAPKYQIDPASTKEEAGE